MQGATVDLLWWSTFLVVHLGATVTDIDGGLGGVPNSSPPPPAVLVRTKPSSCGRRTNLGSFTNCLSCSGLRLAEGASLALTSLPSHSLSHSHECGATWLTWIETPLSSSCLGAEYKNSCNQVLGYRPD